MHLALYDGVWVEPTEEWAELELLLECPEQVEYERIRPTVSFGGAVAERSRQTGMPLTTLRRRITSFDAEGMEVCLEPSVSPGKTLSPRRRAASSWTAKPSILRANPTGNNHAPKRSILDGERRKAYAE